MYGISDEEIFSLGRDSGWSLLRQAESLAHPAKVDFVEPVTRLQLGEALVAAPFLAAFTSMRYFYWGKAMLRKG